MAYRFLNTSDQISWSANATSLFTTNRCTLVTCWVNPTALTATRVIWAAGAVWRLIIDPTTVTSLRFISDAATTDGAFVFPAGLATGTWTFIAVFINCGTGPTMDVTAWTATADGPLVQQTVTILTAPVGAFVTSNLVFSLGHGTLAFQGDISDVCAIGENASTANNQGVLGVLADGATAQGELDSIVSRLVVPLWRGDVSRIVWAGSQAINTPPSGSTYSGLQVLAPLSDHPWTVKPASGQGVFQATLNGPTVSARRSPRPFRMVNDNIFVNHRIERMSPSVPV